MDNKDETTQTPPPKPAAKKGRKPKREPVNNEPDTVCVGGKWFVVFD